jgi:exosortase
LATTASPRPRSAPLALPRAVTAGDRHLLVAILLAVALAGRQTLVGLLPYGLGDTPLSFVPLVLPLGGVFAVLRFEPAETRARKHDPFVDGVFFVLLTLAAGAMLLVLPVTMGWDYWLDRLDVPALVILLSALAVGVWGLPAFIRLLPALGYMLLAWPWPWLILDNRLLTPLTAFTASAVGALVQILPFGIRPSSTGSFALLVPHGGHVTTLVVAQACAGVNGVVGLSIVALPLALMARGSWEGRLTWLFAGMAVSWIANVVRIAGIAVATAFWGYKLTFDLLHPVVGLALFALTFLLMLPLAPLFHLDMSSVWSRGQRCEPSEQTLGTKRVALLTMIVLVAGAAELNLSQFSWLSPSTLPRVPLVSASDQFPLPPGWRTENSAPITTWAPFFGASSIASVSTIAAHGMRPVDVQAIMTQDANAFATFSVENCYTFHGYHLQAVQRVALGNGVAATLIDYRQGAKAVATLYWIQPVQTSQGLYHQRIVLIAGEEGTVTLSRLAPRAASGVVSPIQALSNWLADFFSPWVGGHAGPAYTANNAELVALGQAVIDTERRDH